jgi:hypothetical protein
MMVKKRLKSNVGGVGPRHAIKYILERGT